MLFLCLLCTVPDATRSSVTAVTVAAPTSSRTFVDTGGGITHSTQAPGAIIGAVVAVVVVLVVGAFVIVASLIAWKVSSKKASTGKRCTVHIVHICFV